MALWFERALTADGWRRDVRVTLAGATIAAIEASAAPLPDDERHAVAIPALPNLHSHAFQRGMAGLAERAGDGPDSFWTWREAMYRFVDRIEPETLNAIAALAYAEMLEAGFARVGEFHYLHHTPDGRPYANAAAMAEAIAAAAGETGIGLTLLPVFYAHADFGGAPPLPAQRRFVNDLDGYALLIEASRAAAANLGDAVIGIAPHSLRAATARDLDVLAKLAPDAPLHIHIAEQMREVEACIAWSGARPIEWLYDHQQIDARWCLIHATHADEREWRMIAKSGAIVGLCPITEANLGDGVFPAAAYQAAGGAFGIGSDSNVLIDAAEELRLLEYGQRLSARGRNMLAGGAGRSTGAALWRDALAGGGRALGAPTPGIAVGASADFLSLTRDHPLIVAREGDALIDSLVFGGARGLIDCVWRGGVKCVSGGRHRRRDAIEARYHTALRALLA